jgi:hypothetical protein
MSDHNLNEDITSNNHGGNEFSSAAHESIKGNKARDQAKIWTHVEALGEAGATCDEIEISLGMSHQTASARVSEMKRSGRLELNGEKRATRTGRNAGVYIAAA